MFFTSKWKKRVEELEKRLYVLERRYEVTEGNLVANGVVCAIEHVPEMRLQRPFDRLVGHWETIPAHEHRPTIGLLQAFKILLEHLNLEIKRENKRDESYRCIKVAKR